MKNEFEYMDFFCERECVTTVQKSCRPRACCCMGPQGPNGKSAYQVAVDNGFIGTEAEWLESLNGATGPAEPFLSSYIEAIGSAQSIAAGENVVFDVNEDALDIAGTDIELDASGTTFTINSAGLYHVEWSVNLESANAPLTIGLLEGQEPASALANSNHNGNYSSGALINVGDGDVPFIIRLHNFGANMSLEDAGEFQNVAASIRILRFADGPKE